MSGPQTGSSIHLPLTSFCLSTSLTSSSLSPRHSRRRMLTVPPQLSGHAHRQSLGHRSLTNLLPLLVRPAFGGPQPVGIEQYQCSWFGH